MRRNPTWALAAGAALVVLVPHIARDIPVDFDISIYTTQGQSLLDGDYPRSEYPTGAAGVLSLVWLARGRLAAGSPSRHWRP